MYGEINIKVNHQIRQINNQEIQNELLQGQKEIAELPSGYERNQ